MSGRGTRRWLIALVASGIVTLGLVPGVASAAAPAKQLYVSLGDSYASGYQPGVVPGESGNTRNGFAYQGPQVRGAARLWAEARQFRLRRRDHHLADLREGVRAASVGPGGRAYPDRTQLAAAAGFLRAHRGEVGLVTVSIGGNDVTRCASQPDPVGCVTSAIPVIRKNVTVIAKTLRRAAGPRVRIVGTTYPDVILGAWVNGDATSRDLASLSTVAFKTLINPALKESYASAKARFADVTARRARTPRSTWSRRSGPRDRAPCRGARLRAHVLCALGDIHARTDGYALIARLVARQLPRR